jgi:hypothetical protein
VPELGSLGTVRGALGNERPYREQRPTPVAEYGNRRPMARRTSATPRAASAKSFGGWILIPPFISCATRRSSCPGAAYTSVGASMIFSTYECPLRAPDSHPTDHGVEGDELLNLRLVAREGLAICFRFRDDEIRE